MTSLRLLPTLQVLFILLAWSFASAFQPLHTRNGAGLGIGLGHAASPRLSSSLFSSMTPPAKDSRSASANGSPSSHPHSHSPVKVVNAAALIQGPAHAAALENAKQHSNSNRPSMEERSEPQPLTLPTQATSTQKRKTKTTAVTARKGPVAIAESMEEILDLMDGSDTCGVVEENGNDAPGATMTLILFHAHYCKICQRATMQLSKAAREYPSVGFARIEARVFPEPVADNLRTLGVSKFPFVQIYRGGNCVASFSTGPTHMFMRKVRNTLNLCLERDEDCWEAFSNDFATEIDANQDARRKLRPELLP